MKIFAGWKQALLSLLCLLILVETPLAHHIMGIPHYAYSENYPQAPVITYKVAAGPYLLEMTGYPGKPVPHELTQMHAYIYKKDGQADVFSGPIQAKVFRENFGQREVVFGPTDTRFEDNMHKFSPVYGEAGKYIVRMEMEIEGEPYEIDLPIMVGDPESLAVKLALWAATIGFLLVVIRAIKIKRARYMARAT